MSTRPALPDGPIDGLIACDGNATVGYGHLSRCLNLARALAQLGQRWAFAGQVDLTAGRLLAAEGLPGHVIELSAGPIHRLVASLGASRALLDTYRLPDTAYTSWPLEGPRLITFDDFGRTPLARAALGINFTVAAPALPYSLPPERLALGPGYFPVRPELAALRRARQPRPEAPLSRWLVLLSRSAQALAHVHTIIAALAAHREVACIQLVSDTPELHRAEWLRALPSDALVELRVSPFVPAEQLYAEADAVITGGGLAKYEAAYLGLPNATRSLTADQAGETVTFAARGLTLDLGLASDGASVAALAGRLAPLFDPVVRRAQAAAAAVTFAADSLERLAARIAAV